jgi:hypothetical protein
MSKSTTIFQEKTKKQHVLHTAPVEDQIVLSRKDHREILKEAYQEGRKDALEEKKKENSSPNSDDAIKQDGKEEAIQANAKQKEENRQRLKAITERQDKELMRAKSVFPFTLFPDTLIIDTTKVTISKKQLFATEFITTIPLKDLADVTVQTVLFLGSIFLKYMPQSSSPGMNEAVEVRIPNLKRGDAIKIKNILKGALVAKAEEIDIARLSPEEVEEVLHKFGETDGVI